MFRFRRSPCAGLLRAVLAITALAAGACRDTTAVAPAPDERAVAFPQASASLVANGPSGELVVGTFESGAAELSARLNNSWTARSATLPEDLTPYKVIWYVDKETPLSADDRAKLVAFLGRGGGVYLSGEGTCCRDVNESIAALAAEIMGDWAADRFRSEALLNTGDPVRYYPNPVAVNGITESPWNAPFSIEGWGGGIGGMGSIVNIGTENGLLSYGSSFGSSYVGAAWNKWSLGGMGRLVVMMDADWLVTQTTDQRLLLGNIEEFLWAASPDANAGGPYTGTEGSPVLLKAVSWTGSRVPQFRWDVLYPPGPSPYLDFSADPFEPTASITFKDDGTFTVRLKTTGITGIGQGEVNTSISTTTVTILNRNPTMTFSAPESVVRGTEIALTASDASDAPADLPTLQITYSCDGGTTFGATPSCHATGFPGTVVNVVGRVTDKDGGYTDYAQAVTVTAPPRICQAGTYESDQGDGPQCYEVPVGYYQPSANQTDYIPCPLPWTTSGTGATSQSNCNVGAPPGSFVSPETHRITPCPAGRYQPLANQDSCRPAPSGYFIPAPGATGVFQPCLPGTFSWGDVNGTVACTPAPAGNYAPGSGNGAPTLCPSGTYQPATGQSSCLPAPPGSYVAFTGAVSPLLCPAGSFAAGFGNVSCTAAPAGTYVPGTGAPSATPCTIGTYQPLTGKSSCLSAPIGSYVSQQGQSSATPCAAGTTTTAVGATSSAQCVGILTLGDAKFWIGLKNSDDVGLRLDLRAEVLLNGVVVGAGELRDVPGGSSGFNNAVLRTIGLAMTGNVLVPPGAVLTFRPSVRRTCFGAGHTSGAVRFWYDGPSIDAGTTRNAGSRFAATVASASNDYFVRGAGALSTTAGTTRQYVDVAVNSSAACPARPFSSLGEWSITKP